MATGDKRFVFDASGSILLQQRCRESLNRLNIDSEIFSRSVESILTIGKSGIEFGSTILGKGGFGLVTSLRKVRSAIEQNDVVEQDQTNIDGRSITFAKNPDAFAVKQIRQSLSDSAKCCAAIDLAKEARFLMALSKHPNIVSLRSTGERPSSRDYFIVIEKLETTFDTIIHQEWKTLKRVGYFAVKQRATNNGKNNKLKSKTELLKESNRDLLKIHLEVMLGISSAFEFLHENKNIKPANIGITFNGVPQVFDFGLAKELKEKNRVGQDAYLVSSICGSKRYMATEVFNGDPSGLSADVYSFTLMLWEVLAISVPFEHMDPEQHSKFVHVKNRRPKIERSWPKPAKKLLERGWVHAIPKSVLP